MPLKPDDLVSLVNNTTGGVDLGVRIWGWVWVWGLMFGVWGLEFGVQKGSCFWGRFGVEGSESGSGISGPWFGI